MKNLTKSVTWLCAQIIFFSVLNLATSQFSLGGVVFSPLSGDFGSVGVGVQSASKSIVVTNNTGAALSYCTLTSSDPTVFSISGAGGCAALANGASCTVGYYGTPVSAQAYTGILNLTCDNGI